MDLDTFQGNCDQYGKYRLTAKEFRSSNHGGAEKPQCSKCGKKRHGQCRTGSYTSSHKDHRKEDGKVTEKETGREPRKVESSKVEKAGTMERKSKGKKGRRLNEITEPSEEQWTGASWEQWPK